MSVKIRCVMLCDQPGCAESVEYLATPGATMSAPHVRALALDWDGPVDGTPVSSPTHCPQHKRGPLEPRVKTAQA